VSAFLRVATWNIHGCVGTDLMRNPLRVARKITSLDVDIIGLQEVIALDEIASHTTLHAVHGPTAAVCRHHGNAILTRHPVKDVFRYDVSVERHEPRGLLAVTHEIFGRSVAVLVTHFGLSAHERRMQVEAVLDVVNVTHPDVLVLLGDFNEWHPRGITLLRLHAALGVSPAVRSWPSFAPVLALDRIWVRPQAALVDVTAHRAPESRASDHLPVSAVINVTPSPRESRP
jgi:endonuclease/exonuclease/phosphatase family metal-dependent hydrolase